jgi:DNA invertase Pin-like site-specific DNA recombinase
LSRSHIVVQLLHAPARTQGGPICPHVYRPAATSIANQSDAIALYAAQRGLTIVRSYEDAGRSGLGLEGRVALQNLLSDVRSGRADFRTILVYDVSRWGRFQDSDESAHYEYLCRQAGVAVGYCAEQFENDGSLMTAVLKNIKRAMAGEFSRELSAKVFAGQRQLTLSGFHVGATPGYGLRRVLLDENGSRKTELAFGQRKSLQSERVVLVPGPPEEVRTVHRAYELFVDEKQSPFDIAKQLNIEGIPAQFGRSWTRLSVLALLSNEKYLQDLVEPSLYRGDRTQGRSVSRPATVVDRRSNMGRRPGPACEQPSPKSDPDQRQEPKPARRTDL